MELEEKNIMINNKEEVDIILGKIIVRKHKKRPKMQWSLTKLRNVLKFNNPIFKLRPINKAESGRDYFNFLRGNKKTDKGIWYKSLEKVHKLWLAQDREVYNRINTFPRPYALNIIATELDNVMANIKNQEVTVKEIKEKNKIIRLNTVELQRLIKII